MEHFRIATANRRQFDHENSFSLSAVNAVALARDLPWEQAFRLLLNQAHRYALLPENRTCALNMLREAGFMTDRRRPPEPSARSEDIEIKALDSEAEEARLYLLEHGY